MEDFIKKLKKGIDKGITIVAAKSKEIVDSTLIKKEIADLEEAKRNTLEALGQIVYNMSQENTGEAEATEAIKEKCAAITSLNEKIAAKEEELIKIARQAQDGLGKITCAYCGAAVAEENKFCGNCGAKIEK